VVNAAFIFWLRLAMTGGGEQEQAQAVRTMFGAIAAKYDFLNHLLSGNIDRSWRTRTAREVERRIDVAHPRILDVGCGTADLALSFSRAGAVVGCDFCQPMLAIGREKISRARVPYPVDLLEGDALCLPFSDAAFDAVVSAFVLRNLANVEKGLHEMGRVLRSGGTLGILDFAMPKMPVIGSLYRFYFTNVLPRIGRWVSGSEGAYTYLPRSVQAFPPPERLRELVRSAGFNRVEFHYFTGGIAVLHVASKKR